MQALDGIRVIDMATVIAGPGAARYLADFGADVVKVEPPGGDGTRRMGWRDPRDGDSYMWKLVARGKRTVVLDLKTERRPRPHARARRRRRRARREPPARARSSGSASRPPTCSPRTPVSWCCASPGSARPARTRSDPGFATMAEAMSGFAAINGEPDGAPLPPPIALTDEVTALAGAFAVMVALRHRDRTGEGQVVDVNLLDTMLSLMGPLHSAWAHLGYEQPRLGSGIPYSVPRGTYRCRDGRWIAISASAESVAARLMELLGVGDDPRFTTFESRAEHREELDEIVRDWVGARDHDDVIAAFEAAHAAIAPVYSLADVAADEHIRARESLVTVDGVTMPGLIARFSRTPGRDPRRGPGARRRHRRRARRARRPGPARAGGRETPRGASA